MSRTSFSTRPLLTCLLTTQFKHTHLKPGSWLGSCATSQDRSQEQEKKPTRLTRAPCDVQPIHPRRTYTHTYTHTHRESCSLEHSWEPNWLFSHIALFWLIALARLRTFLSFFLFSWSGGKPGHFGERGLLSAEPTDFLNLLLLSLSISLQTKPNEKRHHHHHHHHPIYHSLFRSGSRTTIASIKRGRISARNLVAHAHAQYGNLYILSSSLATTFAPFQSHVQLRLGVCRSCPPPSLVATARTETVITLVNPSPESLMLPAGGQTSRQ